jgi:hypothetical protein
MQTKHYRPGDRTGTAALIEVRTMDERSKKLLRCAIYTRKSTEHTDSSGGMRRTRAFRQLPVPLRGPHGTVPDFLACALPVATAVMRTAGVSQPKQNALDPLERLIGATRWTVSIEIKYGQTRQEAVPVRDLHA